MEVTNAMRYTGRLPPNRLTISNLTFASSLMLELIVLLVCYVQHNFSM